MDKPKLHDRENRDLVLRSEWSNKAWIEVYYYLEPIEGEHPSDRIHLYVKDADRELPRGWLMNVQDATDIIYGLSKAMCRAIEDNIPTAAHETVKE
jgi:hypothetical protein